MWRSVTCYSVIGQSSGDDPRARHPLSSLVKDGYIDPSPFTPFHVVLLALLSFPFLPLALFLPSGDPFGSLSTLSSLLMTLPLLLPPPNILFLCHLSFSFPLSFPLCDRSYTLRALSLLSLGSLGHLLLLNFLLR